MAREHAGHTISLYCWSTCPFSFPRRLKRGLQFFFFAQLHSLVKAKTAQENEREREQTGKRERDAWEKRESTKEKKDIC